MDSIIGSVIFEFTGAILKWICNLIYSLIKGKEPASFSEIWGGKEDSKYHEILFKGVSNIMVGFAFYFLLIITLVFIVL